MPRRTHPRDTRFPPPKTTEDQEVERRPIPKNCEFLARDLVRRGLASPMILDYPMRPSRGPGPRQRFTRRVVPDR